MEIVSESIINPIKLKEHVDKLSFKIMQMTYNMKNKLLKINKFYFKEKINCTYSISCHKPLWQQRIAK